jgi:hypothetical protein
MTVLQLNTLLMRASICSMFYIVLRKVGQNVRRDVESGPYDGNGPTGVFEDPFQNSGFVGCY